VACPLNQQLNTHYPAYDTWKKGYDKALDLLNTQKLALRWKEPINPVQSIMDTLKGFTPGTTEEGIFWFEKNNLSLQKPADLAYAIYSLSQKSSEGFNAKVFPLQTAINGWIAKDKNIKLEQYNASKKVKLDAEEALLTTLRTSLATAKDQYAAQLNVCVNA